jgi:hypothetical protein
MNEFPRIPLHVQFPELQKAQGQQKNPSWESFQPHVTHNQKVRLMGDDRPSTHAMSMIRRNPDGTLDHEWVKQIIVDAIHAGAHPHGVRPVEVALLQVVFPGRFRNMEPSQAEILTQLSDSEKSRVRDLVLAHLKEEENWNAGQGGGSVEGRQMTRLGK